MTTSTQANQIISAPLTTTKAPALPIAPLTYDSPYQNQNNNSLRIYFNQIDLFNVDTIQQVNSLNTLNWLGTGGF